jgi:anti-sigma-K factor RskA
MSMHEQFADDLPLYALGALDGDERLRVQTHVEDCSSCRQELERLRGDVALLALSASGPRPPLRSHERLMVAIGKEPRRAQVRSLKPRPWRSILEWTAAAAAVIVVVVLLRQNANLHQRIAQLYAQTSEEQQQLVQAREFLATLTSADAQHFTLVAGKTPPQPQGKAIYVRHSGTLVFLASNMPELPAQKTYELWLIPSTGAPIPAGLFRPNPHGAAVLIQPQLPTTGVEAKTFAITVEPKNGSAAPTSTPIMVGIGE